MIIEYTGLFLYIGIFTLSNFTSLFLNFLILPLYTYYLSTEEYGTIDLVNTLIQLLFPVFSITIVDAVLRYSISDKESLDDCFGIGIKIIGIGCIPLVTGGIIVNYFIRNNVFVICFILIYIVQAFNSLFSAFAKAINKTKQMALITTVTSLAILSLNVLFVAFFKKGIIGYWISTILGNFIGIFLYVPLCRIDKHFQTLKNPVNKLLAKKMVTYSLPLIPNALFWWLNSSLDRWTLTLITSMSLVGLYSCANKLPSVLTTINTIFSQAWNLSLFQSRNDNERKVFFEETYQIYNEVMFCCTIGIIWLCKFAATFMFSKDFYQAWVYVPVLTFGVYINSLNSFLGSMFTAGNQTKIIFSTTLVGSIINLVLNFPLVFLCQGMGAAVATLISYDVVWIMRVYKIKCKFNIDINWKSTIIKIIILLCECIIVIMGTLSIVVSAFVISYCSIFCIKNLKLLIKTIKK